MNISAAKGQSENPPAPPDRQLGQAGIAGFFAALLAVILVAGWINQAGLKNLTRQAGREVMVTSQGNLKAGHPLIERLQDVLYPGYREVLERLDPPLFEASQFTLVNVLLDGGKQISFPYQWWLPLELAAEKPPHVLVFGSSRTREAVRPDILSQSLGGKRVLNLAVSAATPGVMETLFDALFARLQSPVESIVIFVDDFAFSQEYADTEQVWKGLVRQREEMRRPTGQLTEKGRELLNLLPTWRRLPVNAPKPDFATCSDPAKRVEAMGEPPLAERKDWRLESRAVESFARLVAKAEQKAARVILIASPVTDYQKKRSPGFDHLADLRKAIKHPILEESLEFWGLGLDAFLGFGGEACGFDGHHMNPAAAIGFSRRLGQIL
jgi:hypothetical protein